MIQHTQTNTNDTSDQQIEEWKACDYLDSWRVSTWKIQYPFRKYSLAQVRQYMANPEPVSCLMRPGSISTKVRTGQEKFTLTITFQYSYRSFSQSHIQKRERTLTKKEVKLSCWWILYTAEQKDSVKRLLEIIKELGKVAGYETNSQKSIVFVYTNNALQNQCHSQQVQTILNISG